MMLRLLFALALTAAPLPALAQEVLAEYWASSGSLPPEYAWDVTVTIATDGKVTLKHCKGYETEGPGCKIRKGKATTDKVQAIREAALASGLIDRPARNAEDIMVGGGATGGKVWIDGAEIVLPSQPAAADADRVATVLSAIRSAIPDRLARKFIEGN